MGTELVRPCLKEENMEIPAVPPGFESCTSFTLKRVEDKEVASSCSTSASASELQTVHMETEFECSDDATVSRSLRRRPWINYSRLDDSSGDESDSEQVDQIFFSSGLFVFEFGLVLLWKFIPRLDLYFYMNTLSYIPFALSENLSKSLPSKRGYSWVYGVYELPKGKLSTEFSLLDTLYRFTAGMVR